MSEIKSESKSKRPMVNLELIEERFQPSVDQKCALAEAGMVSTAFPEATRAGVEMLNRGGNAVDAACAAAFALGICEPQASGLGGQTMGILHIEGNTLAIDGSSRVPSLAHLSRIEEEEFATGYRATTVPSTVAVLGYLNFHYGRLSWSAILEPAISIARQGYRITRLQRELQLRERENFLRVPSGSGARYFLKDDATPYEVGELFMQPDLARLLEYLAERKPRDFYTGEIAQRIDEDMRAHDGFLRADDLALIPWPIERKPLRRRYREVTVATLPPPAAGRTLLLVLLMLDALPTSFFCDCSVESYHFMAETFRKAFLKRKQRPFDPNTYPQISEKKMISREFALKLARSIEKKIDPELPLIEPPQDAGETTHLSVMDSEGNAVGLTQSIERIYGAKAAAEGLGFLYNNYMTQLETKNPAHPYYLRPNAIPWTSVAPAIIFYKKKPWLVVGSTGSERIYSTVSQFLVNMIDCGLPICEAMRKARFHCSIGGKISIEADGFDPALVTYLETMGYQLIRLEPHSFYLGAIHAALRRQTGSGFQGVAEIRRDGIAEGPL